MSEAKKQIGEANAGSVIYPPGYVHSISGPGQNCLPPNFIEALKEMQSRTERNDLILLAEGCRQHRAYRAIKEPQVDCETCRQIRSARVRLMNAGVLPRSGGLK